MKNKDEQHIWMEMFGVNNSILASSVPKKVHFSLFSPSRRGIQHPFPLCTRVGMLLTSDTEAELCFYIARRHVHAFGIVTPTVIPG